MLSGTTELLPPAHPEHLRFLSEPTVPEIHLALSKTTFCRHAEVCSALRPTINGGLLWIQKPKPHRPQALNPNEFQQTRSRVQH